MPETLASTPLETAQDLDQLIQTIGDKKVVMLGEATHGTKEFYEWRDTISRRLIEEHGFQFVAVEGDWPDCYQFNQYAKAYPSAPSSAREAAEQFDRWPSWMWANEQVITFIEWLRTYNQQLPKEQQTGFYGLDVYSLSDSIRTVVAYLKKHYPEAAEAAISAYECFDIYKDEIDYAYATAFAPDDCQQEVAKALEFLLKKREQLFDDAEKEFNMLQNARIIKNAEHYYRVMLLGNDASWNIRDHHMMNTLNSLVERYGKGIVWAHNTHIGDARATDMAAQGVINIGQLARQKYGKEAVALVGFSTYQGQVVAAKSWDSTPQIMNVPPAKKGSWEHAIQQKGVKDALFMLQQTPRKRKMQSQRAIGVVYHPQFEHGNYVPTTLHERYDALLHIDTTSPLQALETPVASKEVPETYPSAV